MYLNTKYTSSPLPGYDFKILKLLILLKRKKEKKGEKITLSRLLLKMVSPFVLRIVFKSTCHGTHMRFDTKEKKEKKGEKRRKKSHFPGYF